MKHLSTRRKRKQNVIPLVVASERGSGQTDPCVIAGGRCVGGVVGLSVPVLPDRRGRGFATEAAQALTEWALAQAEVERAIAACAPGNAPSIRVLEKVAFVRIGERAGELLWELRPSA